MTGFIFTENIGTFLFCFELYLPLRLDITHFKYYTYLILCIIYYILLVLNNTYITYIWIRIILHRHEIDSLHINWHLLDQVG